MTNYFIESRLLYFHKENVIAVAIECMKIPLEIFICALAKVPSPTKMTISLTKITTSLAKITTFVTAHCHMSDRGIQ